MTKIVTALLLFVSAHPQLALADLRADYENRRVVYQAHKGNLNRSQPKIPAAAKRNTSFFGGGSYEARYKKIYSALQSNRSTLKHIKNVARKYGIDPIHIIGAIIGEHTYNVDVYDRFQTYAVKASEYSTYTSIQFKCKQCGLTLDQFLDRPDVKPCENWKSNYDYWTCVEDIWTHRYRGRNGFPALTFNEAFMNPFYLGQTYGLGQLSPMSALKSNDVARKFGGQRRLTHTRPYEIYKAIMDDKSSIHYLAAVIRIAIDSYKTYALFDISNNPGLTATLYNLGQEKIRAQELYEKNLIRLAQGKKLAAPEENYYGWWVNVKVPELRMLLR